MDFKVSRKVKKLCRKYTVFNIPLTVLIITDNDHAGLETLSGSRSLFHVDFIFFSLSLSLAQKQFLTANDFYFALCA
jgi:hypothetical protein